MKDKVTAQSETIKKPLVVWVIYQGKDAEPYINKLSRNFSRLQHENEVIFHLSEYNFVSAGVNIFNSINEDIDKCDAAVALVTNDDRKASEAGNIWLEIGMWIGKKNSDDLLICVHKDITSGLISDLGGIHAPTFDSGNDAELWGLIQEHVYRIKEKYSSKETKTTEVAYSANNKIHEIFEPPDNRWLITETYKCYRQNGHCSFRENSLEFSAELLRMGRVNYDRFSVICILFQIGESAKNFIDIVSTYKTNFRHYYKVLKDGFNLLLLKIDTLFKARKDCNILEEFIKSHIECASVLCKSDRLTTSFGSSDYRELDTMAQKTKDYFKWAKKFVRKEITFDNIDKMRLERKNDFKNWMHELERWGYYSTEIAQTLESLGNNYFQSCRHNLKSNISKIGNPKKMHQELKNAVNSLPHNVPESGYIRIWPSKCIGEVTK